MPSWRVRGEEMYAIHHAIPQGNGGCRIVQDDVDRGWLMRDLRQTMETHGWILSAFALLDTHLHLVVETPQPNMSRGMRLLLGRYARRFNKRHGRYGALFRGRYWSRRIVSSKYLVRASTYTVANPVAAGMCAEPGDWRWSSYRETAGLCAPSGLLAPQRLLATLSHDPARARELYVALVAEECVKAREQARRQASA